MGDPVHNRPGIFFLGKFWAERKQHPSEFAIALATVAGAIIAFVGVVAAVWTLLVLKDEAQQIIKNQDAQAYANVYQSQFAYDRMTVDTPDLNRYFDQNIPVPEDAEAALKVKAAVEYHLDLIDYFFSQAKYFRFKDEEYKGWIQYYRDSFSLSQAMCQILKGEQGEYGLEVKVIATEAGCAGIETTPEEKRKVDEEIAVQSH